MFISTYENSLSENLVLCFLHILFYANPRDKVGSCSDINEVSMVVLSVSFQRPVTDSILELEMNFGFMNE